MRSSRRCAYCGALDCRREVCATQLGKIAVQDWPSLRRRGKRVQPVRGRS